MILRYSITRARKGCNAELLGERLFLPDQRGTENAVG